MIDRSFVTIPASDVVGLAITDTGELSASPCGAHDSLVGHVVEGSDPVRISRLVRALLDLLPGVLTTLDMNWLVGLTADILLSNCSFRGYKELRSLTAII